MQCCRRKGMRMQALMIAMRILWSCLGFTWKSGTTFVGRTVLPPDWSWSRQISRGMFCIWCGKKWKWRYLPVKWTRSSQNIFTFCCLLREFLCVTIVTLEIVLIRANGREPYRFRNNNGLTWGSCKKGLVVFVISLVLFVLCLVSMTLIEKGPRP